MGTEPQPLTPAAGWQGNYFTYFTEVEEHFRKARGTGLFLFSPLDWALIEGWKDAGLPLAAVLRGIDVTFEKWRSRKTRFQVVNSLAYCTQAVMAEAQLMAGTVPARQHADAAPPFPLEALRQHLERHAATLRTREGFEEIGTRLQEMAEKADEHYRHLEALEQHLTVLEERLRAVARLKQTEDELLAARRELDTQLRPYRSKMTADQLSMLERQYLDRRLLESARLPRLSLFYL